MNPEFCATERLDDSIQLSCRCYTYMKVGEKGKFVNLIVMIVVQKDFKEIQAIRKCAIYRRTSKMHMR